MYIHPFYISSHFHLDHCGALPYFTEMCGYNGPILMTHPTKAISPILLVMPNLIVIRNVLHALNFLGRLQKNQCGKKRRTEFLYFPNDQRLYEESDHHQPAPNYQGTSR